MKLILRDDDGTVLSTEVSDHEWDMAQVSPLAARAVLNELQAGGSK